MDAGSDFTFLADEKFDFDISLSPSSAKEEPEDCDDEVFIGPVKHKEKCVSAAIHLHDFDKKTPPPDNDQVVWSPLSGDKFVEIFKEAHLLALQLECSVNDDKKEMPQTVPNPSVEKFVQESKSKLKLIDTFNAVNKTPIAIKRETYCIQDSPLHQLPPAVQQRIVSSIKDVDHRETQRSQSLTTPLKAPKVVKGSSVSPITQKTKPLLKSTVPPLSTGKIVSRLQPMKATAAQSKINLTMEKPKAVKKQIPMESKKLNSMGSTEDLLSANSSIASDISDSSLNNSCIGQSKKTLTLPSKLNLGKTHFKTPSATSGLRRNTSSSSSSRSSVNTSLNSSLSSPPAVSAKLNASINTSINSSRLKPNTTRQALVRPLGGIGSSLKVASSDSNNRLKPNVVTKINGHKPASVSVAQPQTPPGKVQRQTSAPNLQRFPPAKPESGVKAPSTKPQARILPTPTSRLKPPQKSDGLSPDRVPRQSLKPTRLLSCGDIGSGIVQSTPVEASKGMNTSLIGRGISATPSAKHMSALPTPVSRRTSGMLTTPRTVPRAIPSLRPTPAIQASSKSTKKLLVGSADSEQVKAKPPHSPCSTEENAVAAGICCSLNFSPESKPVLEKPQPVALPQHTEVLLIDIEVENTHTKIRKNTLIENDSQPLIDLSNTPELNKQPIPLKPTSVSQLIDLSSPLIKLSPAANKENVDSPLLKF
ncbi:G2 and S phase-expressed protein 1 [Pyxicephalus adspersus]|uniref:G2 and S phase-expressed protein 1 N-terminal domain-containing protein n=1 Tax=Pyxicephalus adspersus TaxID=30357 RepID=A0AAV3ATS3_PYXAD|nr:TPA: hypothetical protein GDO54_007161 [Pyxicephalus adspersus]